MPPQPSLTCASGLKPRSRPQPSRPRGWVRVAVRHTAGLGPVPWLLNTLQYTGSAPAPLQERTVQPQMSTVPLEKYWWRERKETWVLGSSVNPKSAPSCPHDLGQVTSLLPLNLSFLTCKRRYLCLCHVVIMRIRYTRSGNSLMVQRLMLHSHC